MARKKKAAEPAPEKASLPEGTLEMSADDIKQTMSLIHDVAAQVKEAQEANTVTRLTLDDVFKGQPHILSELKTKGVVSLRETGSTSETVLATQVDLGGHLVAVAAAVPRQPGRSDDFLRQVRDFATVAVDRTTLLDLCNNVYKREGLVNNAINKSAALVAVQGNFKVRYVKGKRGVKPGTQEEELHKLLQWWQENVNARGDNAVITGDRGIQAFMLQGVRLSLIEGDHIGRHMWTKVAVPPLKGVKFSLPMNLHTISARNVEIPEDLVGTPVELIYWKPPASFIQSLRSPRDKNVKAYLDKYMEPEVKNALLKDGKILLDPALLFHVKHRGTATTFFGDSMIEPAMNEIAYKRALQALDIVTIENLINRLVIIMLGSDKPDSIYHKQEVTNARMNLLANMMKRIGPSATLLWPGPDLDVKEVGAHDKILDMDQRYEQVEARIRSALGVPGALLSGDAGGGKAAGWSAVVGLAAQLGELQNQYKQLMRTLAERIAEENGYEDVDVIWEFSQDLLANKEMNAAIALKNFLAGLISAQTALEEMGLSFEAEENRMAYEVLMKYRDRAFGPPPAADKQKTADGTGGRPSDTQRPGQPDPRKDTETKTPVENK